MLLREEVEKAAPAILAAHGIAEDRSADVRDRVAHLPRQCLGILAGTCELQAGDENVAT